MVANPLHACTLQATAEKIGATTGSSDKDREVEMKMAKVAATTIGFYLLSWVPYAHVTAIGMLYPHASLKVNNSINRNFKITTALLRLWCLFELLWLKGKMPNTL